MKRSKKTNPSVYRYSVNLNAEENATFTKMYLRSGIKNKSKFIASLILGKEIKIVRVDMGTKDYYMRLTTLYSQFQSIGVNYNQVVKAIHTNFGEKRAWALMSKLEKATLELITVNQKIIALTHEFKNKWLE